MIIHKKSCGLEVSIGYNRNISKRPIPTVFSNSSVTSHHIMSLGKLKRIFRNSGNN